MRIGEGPKAINRKGAGECAGGRQDGDTWKERERNGRVQAVETNNICWEMFVSPTAGRNGAPRERIRKNACVREKTGNSEKEAEKSTAGQDQF